MSETLDHLAPTVALSGAVYTHSLPGALPILGAITDPGQDTVSAYVVHWGDGTTDSFSGSPSGQTASHTYVDGPNDYTIVVDLTDEDGTFSNAGTKTVTVDNVAPTIALTGADHVNEGSIGRPHLGTTTNQGHRMLTSD